MKKNEILRKITLILFVTVFFQCNSLLIFGQYTTESYTDIKQLLANSSVTTQVEFA